MTDEPISPEALAESLKHFHGSETFYRHALLRRLTYTEGVRWLADKGEAHWLVDAIASHQLDPNVAREEFQVWTLMVDLVSHEAHLMLGDGRGRPQRLVQVIEFTDFPMAQVDLWMENLMLMLPGER